MSSFQDLSIFIVKSNIFVSLILDILANWIYLSILINFNR